MTTVALAAPPTARFQEKRETILAAAARQFNEHGVKGATLSDIAASVGLVTTSITYYYRRKEDLATACFERAIAAQRDWAEQSAEPGRINGHDAGTGRSTVAQRVARFFELHARAMAGIDRGEQPPLILFHDIRALPSAQAARAFAAYNDMFRSLRALLVGAETSALGREAINARTHLLLSAANGARGWYQRREIDDYATLAKRLADILLYGLAAEGQPWPSPGQLTILRLAKPPALAHQAAEDPADAFLRAATELVNEQGYRGASVDRISARLHVTKGSFYHHHETKQDLISACFERSFAVQRHTLRAAQHAAGPAWQRCCAAAIELVRYQLSPEGPLLRSTATSALPDQAHRSQVQRTQAGLSERIASMLVDGLVDGTVRPIDSAAAAHCLACAINAAAELRRWVPGANLDNVTRLYIRPALMGLLAD